MNPIYFDYMATTPVADSVIEKMLGFLGGSSCFGNPSSTHAFGLCAKEAIEEARRQVALCIGAAPRSVVFTSGATEAINLAIKGVAEAYSKKGKHIIALATEHKAVLETCEFLQKQGFEITYLKPKENGLLDLNLLEQSLRADTILVNCMLVNNEIGVIQDIAQISALTRAKGVLLHVDAVQAIGKIAVDVKALGADLMSLSCHKAYGPKGIGALYVNQRPKIDLQTQMQGGSQEFNLRAGTLAVHQIAGMGEAYRLAYLLQEQDSRQAKEYFDYLLTAVESLGGVHLNGDREQRVWQNLNISIDKVSAQLLLKELSEFGLSTGSACNSVNIEPSHVLLALGHSTQRAQTALRISFGRQTSWTQIHYLAKRLIESIEGLRKV